MPLVNTLTDNDDHRGASADNNGFTTAALVATGACVAAPTAVVLGSLQTTFVAAGAVATASAVASHRVQNGKPAWPFGPKEPADGETPVKVTHNGKEVTPPEPVAAT